MRAQDSTLPGQLRLDSRDPRRDFTRNPAPARAGVKLNFCRGDRRSVGGGFSSSSSSPSRSSSRCSGWWALLWVQLHVWRALAQDDVAPYFKTEPSLPETHLEGNRLILTCLAEGSWPLEFKWLHNDVEITEFSREYKYVIPSLKKSDGGFYQCVVRNRMGALLQRKSEVQVAYMGSFQSENQWKTVPKGQAAVLNVPHIPSYPKPQVTWFKDGHKIIPSNRIAITLENQLVILATLPTDAGNYYVQAVNEKNGENKTSPSIYLNVTRDLSLPPPGKLQLGGALPVPPTWSSRSQPLPRLPSDAAAAGTLLMGPKAPLPQRRKARRMKLSFTAHLTMSRGTLVCRGTLVEEH